jgi:hypothetical protein
LMSCWCNVVWTKTFWTDLRRAIYGAPFATEEELRAVGRRSSGPIASFDELEKDFKKTSP